ncbi:flagellar motor protein MotB [Paenibacillus sp. PCH8]|uniref:flagellar motor protein MotB n=1 Tax=Paenibacillus sp. PCH8 TaxID=2066524 RepID=UPI000CF91818|nr:flagellar motor protein MotB [Paenibacillus sp. PCH8]PQP84013.1 flagellar motor protein MotB [Paenibacillus sp. PCH8]
MKKAKKHEPHEEHIDESWLLPYSDLMTLLLALFIVLFGMSSIDAAKFEQMASALNSALNGGSGILDHTSMNPDTPGADLGKNKQEPKEITKNTPGQITDAQMAQKEQEDLEKLKKRLDQYISKNGLSDQLNTKLNQSELKITISDNALFSSGRADVKPESRSLAKAISSMLQEFPEYEVVVSGHTDNIPISNNQYKDNWDLSADRALNFLKILLLNTKLDPSKFTPSGYGEYHPIASNDSNVGRAQNRRVEVSIIRKYQSNNTAVKAVGKGN